MTTTAPAVASHSQALDLVASIVLRVLERRELETRSAKTKRRAA